MYTYILADSATGEVIEREDLTQSQLNEMRRDGFILLERKLTPLPQRETSLLSLLSEEKDLVGDYNARLESLEFFRGRLKKADDDEVCTLERAIHQDEYSLSQCKKRLTEKRWIIAALLEEYRKAGEEDESEN